jgi:hypothetical protein
MPSTNSSSTAMYASDVVIAVMSHILHYGLTETVDVTVAAQVRQMF